MGRMILHSDCNAFYASVEVSRRPELRGKKVAVCGDAEARHGIILAKSYECKPYGVQTGMAIWEAEKRCPGLILVSANSELYKFYSEEIRKMYYDYTDRVEPFGLDEAWLDVSGPKVTHEQGYWIAEDIRQRIHRELGLTVSIGVADNKVYAKLGSDIKKPDAITVITPENRGALVYNLPASDLLYVGPATTKKLAHYGILTIGDLAEAYTPLLVRMLGINAYMLQRFALGEDTTPVAEAGENPPIKSVGNSMTTAHDLCDIDDIKVTLFTLAESVAKRMRKDAFRCRGVQISVRDSELHSYQKQCKLARDTCSAAEIAREGIRMFAESYDWKKPVRSMGIRGIDLVYETHPFQVSLFGDEEKLRAREDLEREIDKLRERFGYGIVRRGIMLLDGSIGKHDPNGHIQPGGAVQGTGIR